MSEAGREIQVTLRKDVPVHVGELQTRLSFQRFRNDAQFSLC